MSKADLERSHDYHVDGDYMNNINGKQREERAGIWKSILLNLNQMDPTSHSQKESFILVSLMVMTETSLALLIN